jgi:hypothetical protein
MANLYLFLIKFLSFEKSSIFYGKTYIDWQNLYHLTKLIYIFLMNLTISFSIKSLTIFFGYPIDLAILLT